MTHLLKLEDIASYGFFTPINKVFSLISQGEYYNKIGSHINASSYYAGTMAFAVKTTNSKAFRGYKR